MEFHVLGPLQVYRDGISLALGGPRQRAVLAALVTWANEEVGVDRLAGAVWHQPPTSLHSNVRTYIAGLRRLLGDRLVSSPNGYRLVVQAHELDLAAFDELVSQAGHAQQRGELETAAELYGRALAIWRGPPFAELSLGPALETVAIELEQRRLLVVEQRINTRIDLGQYEEVIGELRTLVAENPLQERLSEQLMVALYRSGRRAEAMKVYREAHQRVVAELGVEPGVRLRRLHQDIIAGTMSDPPPRGDGAPAQLPAAVTGFVGREAVLDRLDRMLAQVNDSVVVAVISGKPGVGKTALAVRWGHRVSDKFPHGQLFVDLGGYGSGRPMTPANAVGRLLRGVGVSAERIPAELDARVLLFRTVLAGRRIMIVLDNARTAEQVRPLLPGRAGCFVLVTSRETMAGLAAVDGAHPVPLEPFSHDESLRLLGQMIDDNRIHDERATAAELVRLCGHLPLALRLAAAQLSTRPRHTVRALVTRVQQRDRLSALQVPGDPLAAVRLAFHHSYLTLDPELRCLFRRLALAPGPDLTSPVAAALLDATPDAVEPLLEVLVSANLVDEPEPGRYRLHELLRHYAAGQAEAEDTAAERKAAVQRVMARYLSTAEATITVPGQRRQPMPANSHWPPPCKR